MCKEDEMKKYYLKKKEDEQTLEGLNKINVIL